MRRWLALALLLLAPPAQAIPIADYIATLEQIDAMLAAKQLQPAKDAARLLVGTNVEWSKGTFAADASVLQAILDARTAEGPHRTRLMTTIAELRRAAGMETESGDRRLLERIAAEQEPPPLPKGGRIGMPVHRDLPLMERIAEAISDMLEWLGEKLGRLLDWLLDLIPRPQAGGAGTVMRWIIYGIVAAILILLLFLAISVIRRSSAAVPETVETSEPLGSRADEDPLSRGASEWERYAGALAAAGRFREAIRAWYHAVLVTCYAAGILHFRKGRTNWEYVASLAPSLDWRPEMIELTRRFEREWYGSLHSTPDALEECSGRARQILDTLRGAS